jgi:hypothetical protein
MPLSSGSATFNLFTSQLPPGTTTITARYPGGSGFGPSSASIQVTSDITSAKKPSLQIFVNPNPANQSPAAYGNAWNFTLTLREVNGVPFNFSSLTHLKFYPWSSSPSAVYLADCLNNTYGYCSSSTPSDYFGASTIPAYGTVSIPFQYAAPAPSDPNQVWKLISSANTANPAFVRLPISYFPGALVIEFDTPGATTTSPDVVTSVTVPLLGRPAGASIHLIGAPSAVLRNPGAPPSCQWSHQLMLTESAGTAVTLKHFVAGGTDMSSQIAALWGSTKLGSNNALTASICWANLSAPVLINYEIDGVDDNGNSVTAAMTSGFLNQPSTPTTLTVASTNLSVNSGTLSLNSAGGSLMLAVMTQLPTQVWSVSIFATGNSPNWVTAGPASGMGPGAVLVKPVSGLSAGTYSATILFESADSTPQIVSFPVTYTVR